MSRPLLIAALVALSVGEGTATALTRDCPENRGLRVYAGPSVWEQKWGGTSVCVASQYDCDMPGGKSRWRNADRSDGEWPIAKGISVLDGRGHPIGTANVGTTQLNFGQEKTLNGEPHVYAFSVGNVVSGWIPAACVGWDGSTAPAADCATKKGALPKGYPVVNGRKPPKGSRSTTTYEVVTTNVFPPGTDLDELKIICNTGANEPHKSLADYMPRLKPDGSYTINLVATLPGMSPALGGISSDTFRVAHMEGNVLVSDHVKFHRLKAARAVTVNLFKPGGAYAAFADDDASRVAFLYGYVVYDDGAGHVRQRYGWMAATALTH